jgi:hypothetical protein
MTDDDLLDRHRLLLLEGHKAGCEPRVEVGGHSSCYYRWKTLVERRGPDILRPRERRPPRMPNHLPAWIERKAVAFALAWPRLGPR